MGNGYKKLRVWKTAKDLAVEIYKLTEQPGLRNDYSRKDQIRRSAVSIASNIAEGDERETDKEAVRFFYIAKGSLAELRTQLQIAYEVDWLSEDIFIPLDKRCDDLAKSIGALIKARSTQ